MDFTWSVAHPFLLNIGAPTGFTDATLGDSDTVYPCVAITKGYTINLEKKCPFMLLMQWVGKLL